MNRFLFAVAAMLSPLALQAQTTTPPVTGTTPGVTGTVQSGATLPPGTGMQPGIMTGTPLPGTYQSNSYYPGSQPGYYGGGYPGGYNMPMNGCGCDNGCGYNHMVSYNTCCDDDGRRRRGKFRRR